MLSFELPAKTLVQLIRMKDGSIKTLNHIFKSKSVNVDNQRLRATLSNTYSYSKSSFFDQEIPISVSAHIPEVDCGSGRFLVYKCVSTCGGMGDREKGIVSAFLLALLTNRTFVIDMPKPCDLGKLLKVNVYDWRKCAQAIKGTNIKLMRYMDGHGERFSKSIPLTSFDVAWKDPVIYMQINAIAVDYIRIHPQVNERIPWLRHLTREHILGYVLGILFRVDDRVLNYISEIKKNNTKGKTLVCAHIRFGKNPSIPNDSKLRDGPPNVDKMLSFLALYQDSNKYITYIATDSENVRYQSKGRLKNVLTGNQSIVHIDRSKVNKNASCEGFGYVIQDQVLLSRCDVLLLSRSNLGAMAAYMRGKSDNLYLYDAKKDKVVKVKLADVQIIYKFK